jgi:ankyrin repeat protein
LLLSSPLVLATQLGGEPPSLCSLIMKATEQNDLRLLRKLLSAGDDVAEDVSRAVLYAVHENKVPALKQLLALSNKQSIETRILRSTGFTPLLLAAHRQHCDIVRLLLSHRGAYDRVQLNLAGDDGFTALSWAAHHGNLECMRTLLNAGADVNHATSTGYTPLHFVANRTDVKLAQLLLRKGAAVNARGECGFTPLHNAVYCDNVAVAELLLRSGADVEARYHHSAPLHVAADKGSVTMALLLLKHGAALNARTGNGTNFTALDYAVHHKDAAMMKALRAHAQPASQNEPQVATKAEHALAAVCGAVLVLIAVMLWLAVWALYVRLRRIHYAAVTRRGRGMTARAAWMARSLVLRLKLVLLGAAAEIRDFISDMRSWLASSVRSFRALLLRRSRRAPPTLPPSPPAALPLTPARGTRRRRQQRRVTQQIAPADDAASAAGAAHAETRSDDGAADEDADAAVMQQAANEAAALAAAEAAAAAAKRAKEAAAARQAAEAAAAVAARQRALEAAATAEKAAAETVATPPAVDRRLTAAADSPLPAPVLKECCVCLSDMPAAELLVVAPCGHRCLCDGCWQNLQPTSARRCPICSAPAVMAMRVFEA